MDLTTIQEYQGIGYRRNNKLVAILSESLSPDDKEQLQKKGWIISTIPNTDFTTCFSPPLDNLVINHVDGDWYNDDLNNLTIQRMDK